MAKSLVTCHLLVTSCHQQENNWQQARLVQQLAHQQNANDGKMTNQVSQV
jgi:hypothetical protein